MRGPTIAGRPIAVALVAGFPPPAAGMTVAAETLRRRLSEDGLTVVSVATNPQLDGALACLGRVRLVRGMIGWCRYAWALRRLVRVDLVHVFAASWLNFFLFAVPAVVLGRLLRRRVVLHYHGGGAGPFMRRCGWLVMPFLSAVDRLVVPSCFLAEVFSAWGLRVEIIANSVDVARVPATVHAGDQVVLSCRILSPLYDIATAIDAFARLAETSPGSRMIVAGDGPDRGALERRVAAHGLTDRVEFLGNVPHDDMAAVRERATILLNTSRVDNQPVSLIEAMAAGLAIVSTDAGGIPDLAKDGVEALLAPVGDVDALAESLQRVATDPAVRRALVAAGLERARSYRWSAVGEQWCRLHTELLHRGQQTRTPLGDATRDGVGS